MGGLNDAIKGAATLAGIKSWRLRELPEIEDPYMRVLSQLGGELKMSLLKNELGESVRFYNILKEINELSGIQARLPYLLDVR